MNTVFNDNSSKGTKFLAYLIIFLVGFWFLLSIGGTSANSYDNELTQAKEAYAKALQGHCSIIGAKTADCYSGGDCDALNESITWFMSSDGYGTPPELTCKQKPNLI